MRSIVTVMAAVLVAAGAVRADGLECVGYLAPWTLGGWIGPARSVSVSPDGRLVAVADGGKKVTVHHTATGVDVTVLEDQTADIRLVGFTPDGRRLVGGLTDGRVLAWATDTWQVTGEWGRHAAAVSCLAFTQDGKRAVTGGEDKAVMVYDAAAGRAVATLTGHARAVRGVGITPDGGTAVSAGEDAVRVWDVAAGKQVRTLGRDDAEGGSAAAVSPDGRRAAAGHPGREDGTLWDLATGKEVARLEGLTGEWTAVRFEADGKTLTAAGPGGFRTWGAATGKLAAARRGHPGTALAWSESADGQWAVSGGDAGEVIVWNRGRPFGFLRTHNSNSDLRAWFSADGTTLSAEGKIMRGEEKRVWRTWPLTAEGVLNDEALDDRLRCVDLHASSIDGLVQARGYRYGNKVTVRTREKDKGWGPDTWLTADNNIAGLHLTADGKTVVSAAGTQLYVWDVPTGKIRKTVGTNGRSWINQVAVSGDGVLAAVVNDDKEVEVFDLATGRSVVRKPARVVEPNGSTTQRVSVWGLAFIPTGRLALLADKSVQVWDPTTGGVLDQTRNLPGSGGRALAAGPGGRLATIREEGRRTSNYRNLSTLRTWRVGAKGELEPDADVDIGVDAGKHVHFSPDGKTVLTADDRGWVRLWAAGKRAGVKVGRAEPKPRDPVVEKRVAELLKEMDHPDLTPDSRRRLLREFEQLKSAAGWAAPELVKRFWTGSAEDRRAVTSTLKELGPDAVPLLTERLADPVHGAHVADALTRMGKDAGPAVKAFTAVIDADFRLPYSWDENTYYRLDMMVSRMTKIGPDPAVAVPSLIKVASLDPKVRRLGNRPSALAEKAVMQLKEFGPDAKAAVPALTGLAEEALAGTPSRVSLYAIEALGAIGKDAADAAPVLRSIIRNTSSSASLAQERAEKALRLIETKR